MYSWHDVARRTEVVYDDASQNPPATLMQQLARYDGCGILAAKLFCLVVVLNHILLQLLQWWEPDEDIDMAVDYPLSNESSS